MSNTQKGRVKTYDATVERTKNGWAIYVPAVDRHTWTPHLRQVDEMARDLIHVMTGEPVDGIAVVRPWYATARRVVED